MCLIILILREIRVWTFFVDQQDYIKEVTDYSIAFSSQRYHLRDTITLGPSITAHCLGQEGVIIFSVMDN